MLLANDLEECDWDKTSRSRDERIASLVPLSVVLTAQHVEEVALVKCQLLTILVLRLVVVEGFDDFLRRDNRNRAFRGEGMMGRRLLFLVTFERPTNGLGA